VVTNEPKITGRNSLQHRFLLHLNNLSTSVKGFLIGQKAENAYLSQRETT
jgi:hypothetical protein